MRGKAWYRKLIGQTPSPPETVSRQVAQWLKTNTFHHSQFSDIPKLVAAKQAQGLTISLCLPTLNEEQTIGKEIVLLRSELVSRYPLVDEIAVMDSGSTDRTREIAASFGAAVYEANRVLPEYGEKKGKGENLWKAIYQLTGDIVIYIDADIANIRPHFVYGLVAPLLANPKIQYVKAFYERPLTLSTGVRVSGGGRVTEILIRPLFSLYFPELTAMIQPLSGEYAARRGALEQLSFPIGYGVETAHLLDIYHKWGLQAFAQTDLDHRVHRNQKTHDLGRMAFGIMQTFFRRMEAYGLVRRAPEMQHVLRQFQYNQEAYEQLEHAIAEDERPPMIDVPEYRRKFNRSE